MYAQAQKPAKPSIYPRAKKMYKRIWLNWEGGKNKNNEKTQITEVASHKWYKL